MGINIGIDSIAKLVFQALDQQTNNAKNKKEKQKISSKYQDAEELFSKFKSLAELVVSNQNETSPEDDKSNDARAKSSTMETEKASVSSGKERSLKAKNHDIKNPILKENCEKDRKFSKKDLDGKSDTKIKEKG